MYFLIILIYFDILIISRKVSISKIVILPFYNQFINTKLAAEEEVYIACFVGCTYHCG